MFGKILYPQKSINKKGEIMEKSDDSSFVNVTILVVDGGWTAY